MGARRDPSCALDCPGHPFFLANPRRPPDNGPQVDRLARLLFPNNPRMVRYRKMRLFMFGVFLSLFCAAAVALLFYLANRFRP